MSCPVFFFYTIYNRGGLRAGLAVSRSHFTPEPLKPHISSTALHVHQNRQKKNPIFSQALASHRKTITTLLASGTTVICDRYYHSGIVYSAAKRNPALTLPWARAPEVGLPRPDLVLFLDLEEAQARARGGWGGEVYERGEMQRRVRELFWGLSMGRVEGQSPSGIAGEAELRFRQEEEDLHVVDASPSVEDVAEEIWKVVRPRVEAVERGEVGRTVRRVS